jgi:hypothetical protein
VPAPSGGTAWGQPSGTPGYGAPQDAPPQYGQPPYGQPQYGAPQQPQYGQPQYGQPQYGAPQPPQYGQPQYGQYGQQYAPYGAGTYAPPPLQPGIVPLRPLGLGEIFDGSFRAIRHNPRVMLGLPAITVAIGSLLSVLLGQLLSPAFSRLAGDVFREVPDSSGMQSAYTGLLAGQLGSIPVTLLLSIVLTGLLTASVSRSVIGQKITGGESWRRYGKRSLVLVLYSIGYQVAIALAMVVIFLPAILAGAAGSAGGGVALMLLGALGAVVVAIWLSVRMMFVGPAYILEGQKLWPTITRAWRLTRGSFWRVLGIWLLASVVVYLVNQVVSGPVGLLLMFVPGLQSGFVSVVVSVLATAIGLIVQIVFMAPVVALLYIDVRMRREGLDIELAQAAQAG